MQRILAATDGSPSSAEAVAFAVDLAAEHGAELIVVHVAPALDVVPAVGFGIGGAYRHTPTAADRAPLDDAVAVAEEHAVVVTTALLAGNTVDEIVAFADSHDVDMIVIGSRGHGALAGALLGSVSRGVLQETRRPVLVVRPRVAEHAPARAS
jgi:nucleotide-binding universal stress UspA family protein